MKQIALDACTTDEQKAEIKDITIEKLEDFGVLYRESKNLFPTHAFNLLTDNKNRFAKIQCGLFKGITRDVFIDQKVFDGPIYEQVEDAYQFVLRHINLGANINGVYRNDSYELPIKAVREMIANAVVHRSYLEDACVQVSIYDDRIEVSSPGMLYGGLDIETAKFGKSSCRNAAIAAAFHYMHIVEAWGTGIPRIISNCKDYGLREPLFEEFGNGFRVVMYRKGVFDLQMFADSKEKVVNGSEKVVNDSEKVVNDPEKVVNAFEKYVILLEEAGITAIFTKNIEKVYNNCASEEVFSQANIVEWLICSSTKASNIIAAMKKAKIIRKVEGLGPGKYRFIQL